MSQAPERPELKAWYQLLNDEGYRFDSPDAYHRSLLDAAQALLSGGVIDWDQCESLKQQADSAHAEALQHAVTRQLRDPSA